MSNKLVGAKAFVVPNHAILVGSWWAKSYNESAKRVNAFLIAKKSFQHDVPT